MKETERIKCITEHVEEQKRQTKRVTHQRKAHRHFPFLQTDVLVV